VAAIVRRADGGTPRGRLYPTGAWASSQRRCARHRASPSGWPPRGSAVDLS